ncbi:MAG: transposase [Bacteroidales bacterium]|nr:transposase [Bacteroidales bacterium]
MSDKKFLDRYRIPSARAPWHRYDNGYYHITICTAKRKCFLGEITDGAIEPIINLSIIGKYTYEQFSNVSEHYPYAEIPLFAIMPNHIHAIVIIDKEKCRDGVHTVSTEPPYTVSTEPPHTVSTRWKSPQVDKMMQNISRQKSPLSIVIGGLKRSVTKFAHDNEIPFSWQSRFHDHIIRNTDDLNKTAQYIEQNVAKWHEDEFYVKQL